MQLRSQEVGYGIRSPGAQVLDARITTTLGEPVTYYVMRRSFSLNVTLHQVLEPPFQHGRRDLLVFTCDTTCEYMIPKLPPSVAYLEAGTDRSLAQLLSARHGPTYLGRAVLRRLWRGA